MDQEYKGLTMYDDGTIDVDMENGRVVHLPRPKIGQFLRLTEAMERADAKFRELNERDIPQDLVEAASQMAIADLGTPKGNAQAQAKHRALIAERTLPLAAQLWQNRILMTAENPYPDAWHAILSDLGDTEVELDAMPSWMFSPVGLMGLSGHWMSVPLRHGPTTNRADAEPDETTNTL